MSEFRPLLAATVEDVKHLRFPLLVSPKLDGIRCIILAGKPNSRNIKIIRNRFIQQQLKGLPDGLDGELIVGEARGGRVFNMTTSGVMSEAGEPDFTYYVFDDAFVAAPFHKRQELLVKYTSHPRIKVVPHYPIHNLDELLSIERLLIGEGYEGIMLRNYGGKYKYGRSTMNEQILMKLKRFRDGEAFITGFEEGVHNLNEATTDALGYTTRSNHQDNKVGSGRIGTLLGIDCATGLNIVMSPGRMSQSQREYYFARPKELFCKIAKYKAFDYGKVNVPRFCTFQGFRDKDDL